MDLTLDLGVLEKPAALIVALLFSLYFTPLIRKGAIAYGVVDTPDGKLKKHTEAVPYLGGVAIFLAFLFTIAFTYEFNSKVLSLLLGGSIIVTIGLFDDLKVLSPSLKLAGQVMAALVLIKANIMINLTFIPDVWALVLTILWLVGITNAINLIDVSDGLAAGVAATAGIFLYIVALWSGDDTIAVMTLALVGSTFGFLAYNRPPARIFLGDTGSMFLGFMLAALAMNGKYTAEHRVAAVAPIVLLGVPIFDTFYVMGVRFIRRIPIMRGSPDHFAVRLRGYGLKPGWIAVVGVLASGLLGGAALSIMLLSIQIALAILGGLALVAGLVVVGLWRIGRGPE